MDPSFSKAHFELARTYEALSDYPHARQEYRLAREYDKVHLRACRKFNRIIHRVARRHGVPVVEIGEAFEEVSPHHLPGDNLFLEHVHPNINGHLIMADTLSHFLARRDFIEPEPNWQWGN
ncbi:MAG: hypothetical protein GWM98_09980, partial [Nitrospinaceae bacterium]|nr:hypothetical protein [Nitrospinaceae bacterium]NIR54758.1 hypothetical protein [Nitrospinaceae bacterium]NIS85183.1 hypothetical protein [Nitrospinaceae bacterium]NIT81994.1 hypothetical protein [Nitrospinaceae bacterium]NIU44257.1 hypothetical protein [Nitrospinaceae bacterium]